MVFKGGTALLSPRKRAKEQGCVLRMDSTARPFPQRWGNEPGLSMSLTFLSRTISCRERVKPGVAPTPQARLRFSELMMLLLPTLG